MVSVVTESAGERAGRVVALLIVGGLLLFLPRVDAAESPAPADSTTQETQQTQSWLEPYPVPADPELEKQITELQEALGAINKELVRRKQAVQTAQEATVKAKLYEDIETLRKEQNALDALLRDLIDEARASEWTAIDEALARVRWLERKQEYHDRTEEILRDRQK